MFLSVRDVASVNPRGYSAVSIGVSGTEPKRITIRLSANFLENYGCKDMRFMEVLVNPEQGLFGLRPRATGSAKGYKLRRSDDDACYSRLEFPWNPNFGLTDTPTRLTRAEHELAQEGDMILVAIPDELRVPQEAA